MIPVPRVLQNLIFFNTSQNIVIEYQYVINYISKNWEFCNTLGYEY